MEHEYKSGCSTANNRLGNTSVQAIDLTGQDTAVYLEVDLCTSEVSAFEDLVEGADENWISEGLLHLQEWYSYQVHEDTLGEAYYLLATFKALDDFNNYRHRMAVCEACSVDVDEFTRIFEKYLRKKSRGTSWKLYIAAKIAEQW